MLRSHARAVLAEGVGTALLVASVVGSGIAAQQLTDDTAVQLLFNMVATVAVLGVLIAAFLPVSGASFNPAVTLALVVRGSLGRGAAAADVVAQAVGAVAGTVLAHAMFERTLVSWSQSDRAGWGTWLGEVVATGGLVAVVLLVPRERLAIAVPAWIAGAYLFTSSTSFANPAVTLGRLFTDSFSGIDVVAAPVFVLGQLVGVALALLFVRALTAQQAA